jgi:pimeloyl-ACP methyl ester carboxylesterase
MYKLIAAAILFAASLAHAQQPAAISTDPAPTEQPPASMVELQLPSHGQNLLGVLYLAAGPGAHPTAIIMHGFPGYEQNLDLAQTIRRAGWNVMAVHYRGSWGVHGVFSFAHAMEDADTEIAFLRDPAIAVKYHIDAKKLVLIGHSMGGFMVASAAAHNPQVAGVVMISAWNIATGAANLPLSKEPAFVAKFVEDQKDNDLSPLAGCSPESLGHEIFRDRNNWNFVRFAKQLSSRPVLIFTSDDGLAPASQKLFTALQQAGDKRAQTFHYATDHAYSDRRVELTSAILKFLNSIQ